MRRSVLRAARHHFARSGTRASLRDIADTAGVNVGLIHRHFGRKDRLLREVIDHTLDTSSRHIAAHDTDAVRRMFLDATEQTDFVRMIAWLALERGPDGVSPLADAPQRTIAQVRGTSGGADRDARLMTALTVLYGWSLFSREMLSAFDIGEDRRAEFEQRIADLLAELTRPPEAEA